MSGVLGRIPGQGRESGEQRRGTRPQQPFIRGRSQRRDLLVIADRGELCSVNHPVYYVPTYLYLQIDSLLNHHQRSESRLAKNAAEESRDGVRSGRAAGTRRGPHRGVARGARSRGALPACRARPAAAAEPSEPLRPARGKRWFCAPGAVWKRVHSKDAPRALAPAAFQTCSSRSPSRLTDLSQRHREA